MKIKFAASLIAAAALIGSCAVQAAPDTGTDTDRSHPKVFMKDSVITTKVKAHLAKETMGSLARIRVDTHNHGAVVLTGIARTQEEADKAVSVAQATEGVTSVKSKIRVKKDD